MSTPERSLELKAYLEGLQPLRGAERLAWIDAHPAESTLHGQQIRERADATRKRLDDRTEKTGVRYVHGLDGKTYPRDGHLPYEAWHRILEMHGEGYSMRKIAAEVGCSVGTAHRIAKNYVLSEQA